MLVIAATHSMAVTALMVLAVILLGIVLGIVPVVIFRLVAGGPRRSRRRRRRRHPKPRMFEPVPEVAPAPVPAPAVEPRLAEPEPEPVVAVRVEAVSERHRELYDEEYARQVDRVETLRRTIRTRLAVGAQTNDV
jgi:hypothetical protein